MNWICSDPLHPAFLRVIRVPLTLGFVGHARRDARKEFSLGEQGKHVTQSVTYEELQQLLVTQLIDSLHSFSWTGTV